MDCIALRHFSFSKLSQKEKQKMKYEVFCEREYSPKFRKVKHNWLI